MYFIHKELEVLSFQEKDYKTIIGFISCSKEEKSKLLKQLEELIALEEIEKLSDLILKSLSFIHLFGDGLLYIIKSDKLAFYVRQNEIFEKILAKFYFFLHQDFELLSKDSPYNNLIAYLSFLKEEKKKALILTEEHKKVEGLIDFEAKETVEQELERFILEKEAKKGTLEEEEEELMAESLPLKDFEEYAWETYRREEGKFPLYQRAEDLLELNQVLLGFSTFEGNPPSDLVLTFWKTYYKEKDLKEYLQETLAIQQKLRSLYD